MRKVTVSRMREKNVQTVLTFRITYVLWLSWWWALHLQTIFPILKKIVQDRNIVKYHVTSVKVWNIFRNKEKICYFLVLNALLSGRKCLSFLDYITFCMSLECVGDHSLEMSCGAASVALLLNARRDMAHNCGEDFYCGGREPYCYNANFIYSTTWSSQWNWAVLSNRY